MLFSIIVPIYNMGDSLSSCVESIMKQEYKDFEVVLINDGSKDNSLELCNSLAQKYDNIIVYDQENQGSGPARNSGIRLAQGDYLLFIDSDDELENIALEILAKRIEETHNDLYVFGYSVRYKSGVIRTKGYDDKEESGEVVRKDYSPYFSSAFQYGIQGAPWNKLFKREVAVRYNIEYPALRRHQDEVFVSRFVAHIDSVRFLSDCLYIHSANDIGLIWKKYPSYYVDIVNALYGFRKEIILSWVNNPTVEALIYSEYVNNLIRACFRAYNPDVCKSFVDRRRVYKEIITKIEFRKIRYPKKYLPKGKIIQNLAFSFFSKHKLYFLLDILVKLRLKKMSI